MVTLIIFPCLINLSKAEVVGQIQDELWREIAAWTEILQSLTSATVRPSQLFVKNVLKRFPGWCFRRGQKLTHCKSYLCSIDRLLGKSGPSPAIWYFLQIQVDKWRKTYSVVLHLVSRELFQLSSNPGKLHGIAIEDGETFVLSPPFSGRPAPH